VVNFVLDTEFEGVSITAGYNAYQHDNDNAYMQGRLDARNFDYPTGSSGFDGASKNIDIAMGSSFADGAGHAMAWLTWRENDPLFQGERDYSSCALNAAGTACGGSNTNAAGNLYLVQINPGANVFTPANQNADGSWVRGYGAPYNFAPINYYQRPDERYTFGTSVKYEINEHFKPYMELMYVNKRDSIQIAESGAFFTLLEDQDCANPLFGSLCADIGIDPTVPVSIYVAKRNIEGGPRLQEIENASFRVLTGMEGAINDSWSYNASFLYGQTTNSNQGYNDFLSDRIVDALLGCQPGSFDGCIPYNVWQPGGVTPEAAAALAGVSFNRTNTDIMQVSAYVTGDTGFGFASAGGENVSLVAGVEWREENYDFQADSNSQAGNFAGAGGPAVPVAGGIKVSEFFMEAIVPVLADAGFIDSLNIDLGYRMSDYDNSGNEDTYKIGFSADMGMVRARGGYNRAIRAPNINELFAPTAIALWGGTDPCAGATPEFTLAQCQNTGVTAAQYGLIAANPAAQYNQFVGGNANQFPETADTYTFGLIVTPMENLQLNVDYFDIQLEEALDPIGASNILRGCALTGDAFLCDQVFRNPVTGDLFRGSDITTSGYINNVDGNFGSQSFRGIDVGGTYRWDMLGGRFMASLQGTWLLEQEITPLPDNNRVLTYDCAGIISDQCQSPEWRHIANIRYSRDWFTVNLRWRHYGEMSYENAQTGAPIVTDRLTCAVGTPVPPTSSGAPGAPCTGDGKISGYNYLDLSASAYIGENAEFTVGVNNIADKDPPITGASLALNGNSPGGYDQAGRYFFTSVTFKF
jgi:outer membrane receptor protein involved in Fe transport